MNHKKGNTEKRKYKNNKDSIYFRLIKIRFNISFLALKDILLIIYISFNLIDSVISQNKVSHINRKLNLLNEIKIKTIGKKKQNLLYIDFIEKPSKIIINDNPGYINENNTIISSLNDENIIIMKWNYKISSCTSMFKNLTNIIEIDMSNFDSSEIDSMNQMFSFCVNLKKVILGENFKSSHVKDMGYVFNGCESLISLGLSHLDTSSSNNFAYMFANCILLTSLDLSNFNTSSAVLANSMFSNCHSLKSINLSSFNTTNWKYVTYFFF